MTVVADNLPGYMQYLDLIRDCIEIFFLEPLPPNEVETEHPFNSAVSLSYAYAGEDHRHHRTHGKSEKFDIVLHDNLLAQGRKRRSKRARHDLKEKAKASDSASGMTQLLQDSSATSELHSRSQPHEQDSSEINSSPADTEE